MNGRRLKCSALLGVLSMSIVTLSGCAEEPRPVPDVKGRPVPDAVSELTEANLSPIVEDQKAGPAWVVVDYSPTEATKGDDILLVVDSLLGRANSSCDNAADLRDDGRTILYNSKTSGDGLVGLMCILDELEAPESLLRKMNGTRALDGRQEGEFGGISASWTYHPDNGLDLILEIE